MGKRHLPKIEIAQKPTYVRCATDIDFYKLFQVIEERSDCCFLLESLGEEGHTSRYSVIGFDPAHIINAHGSTIFFDGIPYEAGNPLSQLLEFNRTRFLTGLPLVFLLTGLFWIKQPRKFSTFTMIQTGCIRWKYFFHRRQLLE